MVHLIVQPGPKPGRKTKETATLRAPFRHQLLEYSARKPSAALSLRNSARSGMTGPVKIYTRTGDGGETGLFGGARVAKTDPRIEAVGTIDELNAALGLVGSHLAPGSRQDEIARLQSALFTLGAEIGCLPEARAKLGIPLVDEADVEQLEQAIDTHESTLPPLRNFILPGGTPAAAQLHLARAICRRAERRLVPELGLREVVGRYVNRLGDYLFVLARAENYANETSETSWSPRKRG
jgi:cob(I)alamin adenosyltransferase